MSAADIDLPDLRKLTRQLANDALSGHFDLDGVLARWSRLLVDPRPLTGLIVDLCARTPQQRLPTLEVRELQTWLLAQPELPELIQIARPRKGPRTPALEPIDFPPPPLSGAPTVHGIAQLAQLLGSDARELEWLSGRWSRPRGDASVHYVSRLQRKRNGGERLIEAPKSRLKSIQTRILKCILDRVPVSEDAHGFVRGRSPLTHARIHVGAAQVLKIDLANWFLSIHYGRVQAQFLRMGFPMAVARLLAELCTTTQQSQLPVEPEARNLARDRHLPQGAPTSPAIANRVAARLDRRLHGYAAGAGWRYSRYADDLVFSSPGNDSAPAMRAALPRLYALIEDEGFRVRTDKVALEGTHRQQKICGIVVNERLNLDRRSFDLLKAQLHAFQLGREQASEGLTREELRQRLIGQLAWLRQLNPRRAAKLERYLVGDSTHWLVVSRAVKLSHRVVTSRSQVARLHLFEIADQPWCPQAFRDATTDVLEFFLRVGNFYAPIVPRLRLALERVRQTEIVDLCAGGGGPWLRLLRELDDPALRVLLTDKYPNAAAVQRVVEASAGRIRCGLESVDATAAPASLRGFRTMFTAFHHFRPAMAQAILADAVRNRVGIGIFEFTERSVIGVLALAFSPLAVLLAVPFLRPVRWQTLLLTYVIPVVPIGVWFDGIVSCLRTYSPRELKQLTATLGDAGYTWEIGRARSWRSPVPITYLIGIPNSGDG